MSRYHSHFNTAVQFIRSYKHDEPFAAFLKKQFAADKKFGSKDRKAIGHLCYCYFRIGKLMYERSFEERLLAGLFLCSSGNNQWLGALKPEWNEQVELPVDEKLQMLNLTCVDLFPFADELSEGIDAASFCKNHFTQPDLFLRIRPGNKETLVQKLTLAGIDFVLKEDDCIALPNNTKLDDILLLNKEVVIQDYSSQKVGDLLQNLKSEIENQKLKAWDCCAASGGKSIMAKDILGDIDLTVSDVRESILLNLNKRFTEAGIKNYKSFVADLSNTSFTTPHSAYDLIIADVPCSGSGTWGRTPEYISSFSKEQLHQYSQLQQKIVTNIIPHLSIGGYLLYITCSVYKKENENVVNVLQQNGLQLIEVRLLKGYKEKADSMFAALLKRS